MSLLGDCHVVRIVNVGEAAKGSGFAEADTCTADQALGTVRRLAREGPQIPIVVINAFVEPDARSEAIRVDPALLATGHPIGLVARSSVTGLFLRRGGCVLPHKGLGKVKALPEPRLVLPYSIGRFSGHNTPEQAFANGYQSVAAQDPQTPAERNRLALAASLGTETLNGGWWVLGALSGLGETPMLAAWEQYAGLLGKPNDMPRQIKMAARQVRLQRNLPVAALSHAESRTLKAMLPAWPDSSTWQRFATDCARLDPALSPLAKRYQRAAGRIWSDIPVPI